MTSLIVPSPPATMISDDPFRAARAAIAVASWGADVGLKSTSTPRDLRREAMCSMGIRREL
jgi:hypothetical protein